MTLGDENIINLSIYLVEIKQAQNDFKINKTQIRGNRNNKTEHKCYKTLAMDKSLNFNCVDFNQFESKLNDYLKCAHNYKSTIGKNVVIGWLNDIKKTIFGGVSGESSQIAIDVSQTPSSATQTPTDATNVTNLSTDLPQEVTTNEESFEQKTNRRFDRLEKLILDKICENQSKRQFVNRRRGHSDNNRQDKTCFTCGRRNHLSYNCFYRRQNNKQEFRPNSNRHLGRYDRNRTPRTYDRNGSSRTYFLQKRFHRDTGPPQMELNRPSYHQTLHQTPHSYQPFAPQVMTQMFPQTN